MPTVPVRQALELALREHQAGRWGVAENIYRQVLSVEPENPDALHLLGVIAHQNGAHSSAVELFQKAIRANPRVANYHNNLGNALHRLGRFEEAVASYRRALDLAPDSPGTYTNLGAAYGELGRFDDAIAAHRKALEIKADFADAHANLSNALRKSGRFDEAVAPAQTAVRWNPAHAEAHHSLGAALSKTGRLDEAIAAYRRALEINPRSADAHADLSDVWRKLGRFEEAVASAQTAVGLNPGHAEAHNNLGVALGELGRWEQAGGEFREACRLKPLYAEARGNLGNALQELGRLDEAIAELDAALKLVPEDGRIRNSMGVALDEKGCAEQAIQMFRQALHSEPNVAEAYSNLANVLKDQGQLDEALECFRNAVRLKPGDARLHSNLILTALYHPGYGRRELREECRLWDRAHGVPLARFILPHRNDPDPGRRLKIGYVSPDFRDHVVGRNILPLIRGHDRHQVEIFCYSGVKLPDALTRQFQGLSEHWRETLGKSDEAVVDQIRSDGIDILVDLSLHVGYNRLPIFARKPAPVQVSFAGYPGSTGLSAIDCRLTDRHLEPVEEQDDTETEVPFRIPSFWCFDPLGMALDVGEPPVSKNGFVTFGCMNNFCKVNGMVVEIWKRILGRITDARLMVLCRPGNHRARFLREIGVAAERVQFVENCPREQYLAWYRSVDIALDTFPYNGHTTTLDALWMGVPCVTLTGDVPVSRAGLSQLSNIGLEELATRTAEDYEQTAVALANDLPRLSGLRRTLRCRMEKSVLMDASRFTSEIEQAYRAMWKTWCDRQSLRSP